MLGSIVRNKEQFELVAATLRALLRTGQPATAAALCDACLSLFGKCVVLCHKNPLSQLVCL